MMSAEPDVGREIGVLDIVIAPPGVSVFPSITIAEEGPAWGNPKALEPMEMVCAEPKGMVLLLPMTRAKPAFGYETGVLTMVTKPPGVRV